MPNFIVHLHSDEFVLAHLKIRSIVIIQYLRRPQSMTTVASGTVIEVSAIFVEIITLQNPSMAGLIASTCSSLGTKECKTQICKASSPTSSSRTSTISVIPGTKTKIVECNRASSLIKKTIIPLTALETCGSTEH